jgi:hypothetical protein
MPAIIHVIIEVYITRVACSTASDITRVPGGCLMIVRILCMMCDISRIPSGASCLGITMLHTRPTCAQACQGHTRARSTSERVRTPLTKSLQSTYRQHHEPHTTPSVTNPPSEHTPMRCVCAAELRAHCLPPGVCCGRPLLLPSGAGGCRWRDSLL